VKLLHLGIQDTFRNMLLIEGLGELLPRDTPRVLVGVTVAIPPCACSASELVGSDPHTLLISAGGESSFFSISRSQSLAAMGSSSAVSKVGGLSLRKPSNFY
jgi:hypothetical protein